MSGVRLDKWLTTGTALSRREAAALIRRGEAAVDGVVVRSAAQKINPDGQLVTLRGQAVGYREYLYIMMNKPAGVLSASRDTRTQTVVDLVPPEWQRHDLFPAGRLDKDTTGFVLLTDDGDTAHRLLAPHSHIDKEYIVHTDAPVTQEDVVAFAEGMTLPDGTRCRPAGLVPLAEPCTARVVLYEGKYHQIKRMLAARGKQVVALKRTAMGGLTLDPALAEGECRLLSEEEIRTIFRLEIG